MTFDSTYDEYQWLRKQNGWHEEDGMIRSVWDRCEELSPGAHESMLQQLRVPLAHKDRYVQQHGEVW